jgi:hypothetical protein
VTLQEEIDTESREIQKDSYPISIGELISMYTVTPSELDIHPEFQRFFRWDDDQKSKFIESILLGIPIPPIFVSQREDGVWDVIDGLQRLSTIFGFVGCLKDENNRLIPPLELTKTKYLPSLKGKKWDNPDRENSFTQAQRLYLKRGKIDVQIVKKESDPDIKYELFQRINTLGSKLSDQELRNCIFIMYDNNLFKWIDTLAKYPPFVRCADLSEKDCLEKFNQELVSRFFVIRYGDLPNLGKVGTFSDYITNRLKELWGSPSFDRASEERIFRKTFDLLDQTMGEDSFKKYNAAKRRFEGRFLVSSFEAIAIGLSVNIDRWEVNPTNVRAIKTQIRNKIIGLLSNEEYISNTGMGKRFHERIAAIVPLGREAFH